MESLAGEEPLAISSISPLLAKGELQVPGGQHLRPARRAFRRPKQGRHEVWRAFSEALGEKAVFVTHAGLGAQAAKRSKAAPKDVGLAAAAARRLLSWTV